MDTVLTIINYGLMTIAVIVALIGSSNFKDYPQKWRLWIYEAILTLCLFAFLEWSIPYSLFVASLVIGAWNPYEPITGTDSAKFEEEQKKKNLQYAKEHPLKFGSYTPSGSSNSSSCFDQQAHDSAFMQKRLETMADIRSGLTPNGTDGVWQ